MLTPVAHSGQRLDEQRRVDHLAEASRQETMLQLVSSTLTSNTSHLIKQEIQSQVIPSLAALIETAIQDQIADGFARALTDVSAALIVGALRSS